MAILVRDVNDNAPEFNRSLFDVTIPLNLPADTELIRLIAVDADTGKNADIEYSLRAPGSFQELFEVNSKSGVVSLAKRLGTTMENVAEGLQYRIDIDAIDHGSPPMSSSASLIFRTANVNPSSPVFDKVKYIAKASIYNLLGCKESSSSLRIAYIIIIMNNLKNV